MDVRYDVDLKYDTDYDCEQYGCDNEGICRCGSISNPRILSVNSWVIANHFADLGDPLQHYAIERYCARLETDDFKIDWSHSYYGDEIDSVELNDSVKQKIVDIKNLQGTDLIEFALKNEYGDVLPQYRNRTWGYIQKAPFEPIILGKTDRRDINKDRIEFYKSNIGNGDQYKPVLLCELHEQIFRVIDGYHRYMAIKELGIKNVDIIYYERQNQKPIAEFELSGAL